MTKREKVVVACKQLLLEKLEHLQAIQSDLQEALLDTSKSSAGDKHETGRAMAHLEQEKTGMQLLELQKQLQSMEQLTLPSIEGPIQLGSLVHTDKGLIFLAIGLGTVVVDEEKIMVLSPASPLGKVLCGQRVGATVQVNAVSYSIRAVLD